MPPVISSISPNSAQTGGGEFSLTVRGANFTQESVVIFGGTEIPSSMSDSGVVLATVPASAYATFSLGGLAVLVRQGAESSNTVGFQITAKSNLKIEDAEKILEGFNFPDLENLTAEDNPYLKQIDNVEVYRVKAEDSLQAIAAYTTGNAENWADIVMINNLRHPYISEDPKLTRGTNDYTAYLTRNTIPGDNIIYVNGSSPWLIKDSVLFFTLESPLSDGTTKLTSDVVKIDKVWKQPNGEARVVLQSQIYNTYEAGHRVDVLATNGNTQMRVVAPGDFILIPSTRSNRSDISGHTINLDEIYEILGSDFSLGLNGNLSADNNGDLLVVNGLFNLNQAIRHLLITEQNELHYHPKYGNPLLLYIGQVNSPTLAILSNYEIQRTLIADPRIKTVERVETEIIGDSIHVRVTVTVDLLNTTQEFNFVIPGK